MYTEEQIKAIVAEKIEIFLAAKKEIPEYTEVYKESVDYYEKISVHTEIGKFPEKIFKNRAPNQSPDEFEYMKENYETTTLPIWTRFLGVLNRMWNDANWSIIWGTEATAKEGQEYLEKNYPTYGNLEHYFKTIFTNSKAKDANGIVCHKPLTLPTVEGENGELVIDQTKDIEPVAIIYKSSQVVGFVDSKYTLIELNEKSIVEYGNYKEKTGKVFEFYDDQYIHRVVQVGRKLDYKFDVQPYWPHALGYVPVKKLKGKPIQKEKDVLFQSPFMSAIGPMNLMLLDSSYLQAAKAGHAFPHKWEYVDECDYNNGSASCINGRIMYDGKDIDCPSCSGTGKKRKASVLGVTQIKAPNRTDDSGKDIAIPPLGWVSPDPTILKFLREEIDGNEQKALSILNLSITTSDVKGSDTAFKTKTDREEMMSSIQGMSDETFEAFEFSHKCILEMRYGANAELPIIAYPKTFSIRNEQDLTEEIAAAKVAGLPDIAIRKLLIEFLSTRFNTQEDTIKVIDLAFATDRLITLTALEVATKKLSGSVANWEDILHTSVYSFIEELALEKGFFDKDIKEQKTMLIELAKAKDKEISPKRLDADLILAGING